MHPGQLVRPLTPPPDRKPLFTSTADFPKTKPSSRPSPMQEQKPSIPTSSSSSASAPKRLWASPISKTRCLITFKSFSWKWATASASKPGKSACSFEANTSTASYVHAYREMWESEADQEQEVASKKTGSRKRCRVLGESAKLEAAMRANLKSLNFNP